jgi:hypothetical protein
VRRSQTTDIRVFFDARGNLKPMQSLTVDESAIIACLEVMTPILSLPKTLSALI